MNGLRIPYQSDAYNYRVIVDNAQTFDYFQVMAPNFTKDIHIGLARIEGSQNSITDFNLTFVVIPLLYLIVLNPLKSTFNGHNDKKWEIVIGCMEGIESNIRPGNQLENLSHRRDPRCEHHPFLLNLYKISDY